TLRTVPLPAAQGVVLLAFSRLSEAADFVSVVLDFAGGPSSCDLLDRRTLSLARESDQFLRTSLAETAESILVIEFEGGSPDDVSANVREAGERAVRSGQLCCEPVTQFKRSDCERILGWRRPVESLLMRSRGPLRPVSVFDDLGVPPDRIALTVQRLQG